MLEFIEGFILGFIAALLLAVFSLLAFRRRIDDAIAVTERELKRIDPKNRGFIYEPPDDNEAHNEEVREEIIEKNNELGADTNIDELR